MASAINEAQKYRFVNIKNIILNLYSKSTTAGLTWNIALSWLGKKHNLKKIDEEKYIYNIIRKI